MLLTSNKAKIGAIAPNFKLLNINGKFYTFHDIKSKNGLVVSFICNHCPYVIDLIKRLVKDFRLLQKLDFGVVAIMPNDTSKYPEDSFNKMKVFASKYKFSFPYLYDEKQSVAKAYNAVCTPDFFAFDKNNKLFYRGRLDDIKYMKKQNNRDNSLVNACEKMIYEKEISKNQINSMGCSIKWKT